MIIYNFNKQRSLEKVNHDSRSAYNLAIYIFSNTAVIPSDSEDDYDDNVIRVDENLQFQHTKKFRKG